MFYSVNLDCPIKRFKNEKNMAKNRMNEDKLKRERCRKMKRFNPKNFCTFFDAN